MKMNSNSIVVSGLLLAAPLLGQAQTTAPESIAPAPTPRFYVGLGVYSSYYQKLGRFAPEYVTSSIRVPVQLTVGYELCPRLAVQASVAYSGSSRDLISTSYNSPITPTGYSQSIITFASREFSVSTLARYTFTCPSSRLQLGALGGLGLEYTRNNSSGTLYTSSTNQVSDTYERTYTKNILLATLGASARYRLNPHFELAYDFTLNRALASDSRQYMTRSLTAGHGLGVRYRFGH